MAIPPEDFYFTTPNPRKERVKDAVEILTKQIMDGYDKIVDDPTASSENALYAHVQDVLNDAIRLLI